MTRLRYLYILLTSVLLLCSATIVLAIEAPVGIVTATRGKVEAIDAADQTRPLGIKSDLFELDTIKTGERGRVQLMFQDNTIISLGANAELKISEYSWDADNKTGVMKTRVEEGVFRVLGGLITKTAPQNFATETPAATIGIRGSMYAGLVHSNNLSAVFLGGRGIYVFNSFGSVDIEQSGFGTRVLNGQAPTSPELFDEEEIRKLIEGLDDGDDSSQQTGAQDGTVIVSETTTDFDEEPPPGGSIEFPLNNTGETSADGMAETTTETSAIWNQDSLTPYFGGNDDCSFCDYIGN